MTATPGMMLWTDAYLADTQHLTTIEHGAYLLIMMAMWRAGGHLPDDDVRLARCARLTLDKWRRIAPTIRELLAIEDGRVSQKRLLQELKIASSKSEKASAAGKASIEAKRLKSLTPGSTDVDLKLPPQANLTKTKTETEKKEGSLRSQSARETDELFDRFKGAYPRREGSQPWKPARDSFGRKIRDGTDPEAIIAGAAAYAKSMAGSEPRFIAQAVTWLNQERWKDDHRPISPTNRFPGASNVQRPNRITDALDKLDDLLAGGAPGGDFLELGPGDVTTIRH